MSNVYRVLVSASRSWTADTRTDGGKTLGEVLDQVTIEAIQAGHRSLKVVHGACYPPVEEKTGCRPDTSGDWLAELWVRDRKRRGWPVTSEPHPAAWSKYGKAAGPRRNTGMVQDGAHRCVAFLDVCRKRPCPEPQPHDSHGATHCADLAANAGIPTFDYRPGAPAGLRRQPTHVRQEAAH